MLIVRQGAVYMLQAVPSIDEPVLKPHPVLVVSPNRIIRDQPTLEVIGMTSTARLPDPDAIPILTRASQPTAKVRLHLVTWAIARWRITATTAHLREVDYRGYVSARELTAVIKASLAHPVRLSLAAV